MERRSTNDIFGTPCRGGQLRPQISRFLSTLFAYDAPDEQASSWVAMGSLFRFSVAGFNLAGAKMFKIQWREP
eukprot:1159128-Pelagomonas_calceolata.AAC.8